MRRYLILLNVCIAQLTIPVIAGDHDLDQYADSFQTLYKGKLQSSSDTISSTLTARSPSGRWDGYSTHDTNPGRTNASPGRVRPQPRIGPVHGTGNLPQEFESRFANLGLHGNNNRDNAVQRIASTELNRGGQGRGNPQSGRPNTQANRGDIGDTATSQNTPGTHRGDGNAERVRTDLDRGRTQMAQGRGNLARTQLSMEGRRQPRQGNLGGFSIKTIRGHTGQHKKFDFPEGFSHRAQLDIHGPARTTIKVGGRRQKIVTRLGERCIINMYCHERFNYDVVHGGGDRRSGNGQQEPYSGKHSAMMTSNEIHAKLITKSGAPMGRAVTNYGGGSGRGSARLQGNMKENIHLRKGTNRQEGMVHSPKILPATLEYEMEGYGKAHVKVGPPAAAY